MPFYLLVALYRFASDALFMLLKLFKFSYLHYSEADEFQNIISSSWT